MQLGESWFDTMFDQTVTLADANNALLDTSGTAGLSSQIWDGLTKVANIVPSILTGLTQYQLAQVNVERARQGLNPINTAQYGPQVGVRVGPDQATQKMIMYGGMALLGLLAFNMMRRR